MTAPILLINPGAVGSPLVEASGKPVTAYNGAGYSAAQQLGGQNSILIDGSAGAYASVTSSEFNLGAAAFTFDVWLYMSADSPPDVGGERAAALAATWPQGSTDGYDIGIVGDKYSTGGGLYFDSWGGNGVATIARAPTVVQKNVWRHLAFSRAANGTRLIFYNGAAQPVTISHFGGGFDAFVARDNVLTLGRTRNSQYPLPLNGFLAYPRLRLGVAHTENFTPEMPAALPTVNARRWGGADWVPVEIKRFSGVDWVPAEIARSNGTGWV